MYEVSSVSSRKGCSKQIHDPLTGDGFLVAQGCFCASVFFFKSGLHHDFGTFFFGNWQFRYFLAMFFEAAG